VDEDGDEETGGRRGRRKRRRAEKKREEQRECSTDSKRQTRSRPALVGMIRYSGDSISKGGKGWRG